MFHRWSGFSAYPPIPAHSTTLVLVETFPKITSNFPPNNEAIIKQYNTTVAVVYTWGGSELPTRFLWLNRTTWVITLIKHGSKFNTLSCH